MHKDFNLMFSQPLVSVVTPVYNGAKYLAECIESVLAQTYQNFEYVIVDNCSTDQSLEIAQNYASKDTRVKIIKNTKHLNHLQNFNHALKQISQNSKNCKEVHADDFLFPDCIEKMVEVAETNSSITIVSAYRLNGNKVDLEGLPYGVTKISGNEICRKFFLDNIWVFGPPNARLIRSEEIRKRRKFYDEEFVHTDTEICFEILKSSDFGFVHQVLTFTRLHDEAETANAIFFNSYLPGKLKFLNNFGRYYLNDQEYNWYLKKELKKYYRFLGQSLILYWIKRPNQRRREFYDYHKNTLKSLGYPLISWRLINGSLAHIYNRILHRLMISPKMFKY